MAKRERFERSDVPRPSVARNICAVVAIVAVFAGAYLLVRSLWARVQREEHLEDDALSSAVEAQTAQDVTAEGYERSQDSFESVLVLRADGLEDGDALVSAQLLVADETAQTAVLMTLPTDVTLAQGDATTTLADLYANEGAAACVAPLSAATGLSLTHVIVTTGEVWPGLAALAGVQALQVSRRGADLLDAMVTDLGAQGVADLAGLVGNCGVASMAPVDAPTTVTGGGDDGSAQVTTLDAAQLLEQAGVLVPAAGDGAATADASGSEAAS